MESELKKMQEKLLQGGINIKDRTTQQDKEIEIKRQKLAEERLKERTVSKYMTLSRQEFDVFHHLKWNSSYLETGAILRIGLILKLQKGNSGEIEAAGRIGRKCQRKL